MDRETLDNLIVQESDSLCHILRRDFELIENPDYQDASILSLVSRLEELIKERKDAR